MLLDFRSAESGSEIECDVCVIGAGAAGITLARELAGGRLSVCLLESGGLSWDEGAHDLNRGAAFDLGVRYQPLEITRARFFGGTTNLWLGACTPLDAGAFRVRPWVPHSGWPISAAALDPYYRRAQAICQLGPYEYGPALAEWAGVPAPDVDPARVGLRFRQYSPPTRFGEVYRRELETTPRVRVLLHATATELIAQPGNSTGSVVKHVAVRSLEGTEASVRARAVVLAGGAIENARLLLNSDSAEPAGLGNRHDLVGRFFMEHTFYPCGFVAPDDYARTLAVFEARRAHDLTVVPTLRLSAEVQRKEQVLESAALLDPSQQPANPGVVAARRIARALDRADLPDDFGADLREVLANLGAVAQASWGKLVYDDPSRYEAKGLGLFAQTEQAPNPESRVALAAERDALGMRRVSLDWRLSELDRRTVEVMARKVGVELTRLGLGRVRISERLLAGGDRWHEELAWGHHHAGTTRMSHGPRQGVVDPDCRVHGVANLYAAGGSVFPTCGDANPTLTIVAMALRLADHLETRLT